MVAVGIGAVTFLGVAAPMSAVASTMSLDNPEPSAASVALASLPDCVGANIYPAGWYLGSPDGSNQQPAVDLGWIGKPHVLLTDWIYGGQAEIAPQIPCTMVGENNGYSSYLNLAFVQNIFGTMSGDASWYTDIAYTCVVNGADVTVSPQGVNPILHPRGDLGGKYGGRITGQITAAECPRLKSVRAVISTLSSTTPQAPYLFVNPQTWVWQASAWTSNNGNWTPATSPQDVSPAGQEVPIVCKINNSGGDILAIIGNVVSSTAAWVPCMLIPAGWDRAGKITEAWASGPIGQLVTAYKVAVPHGISCGAVGTIPFFGRTIGLDTCQADFAPGWIKVVVTYVMILGIAALVVRRIMWSVGSRG